MEVRVSKDGIGYGNAIGGENGSLFQNTYRLY